MRNNNIKNVKPSPASRYKQGYIDPNTCKKVITRSQPIIYRSSYELKFIEWCERCADVIRWDSEPTGIPYVMHDGSKHTYYPDFYIETKDNKYLIEIKPKHQTVPPKKLTRYALNEWVKNNYKWYFAKEWCKKTNINFRILTENTIDKLKFF